MIELCCKCLSVQCIWLYVVIMSRTSFRVNPYSIAFLNVKFDCIDCLNVKLYRYLLSLTTSVFLHCFTFFSVIILFTLSIYSLLIIPISLLVRFINMHLSFLRISLWYFSIKNDCFWLHYSIFRLSLHLAL